MPKSRFAPAIALALTLCVVCPTHAQLTVGAPPPWAAEPAPADHAKDIPTDETLLRQHLAGGDSGGSGAVNPPARARPVAGGASMPSAAQGQRGDADSSVAAAVKDFVRPLNEGINNASVVQAVREIDATLSSRVRAEGAEGSPDYGQRGTDAAGTARGGRKTDPDAVALMWQQLVDEILPWAIGGALVFMLGYGGYFWLKLIKHKNLKQGDKRRAVRRNHQRERPTDSHTAGRTERQPASRAPSGEAQAEGAAPAAQAAAHTAASSSGRSFGSPSRRSSGRSSSRTSGGSGR